VVNATPWPLYPQERDPVTIVLETGWAPGPVCKVVEKLIYANKVHNTYYITRHCDTLRGSNHCHGDSYRYNSFGCYPNLNLYV